MRRLRTGRNNLTEAARLVGAVWVESRFHAKKITTRAVVLPFTTAIERIHRPAKPAFPPAIARTVTKSALCLDVPVPKADRPSRKLRAKSQFLAVAEWPAPDSTESATADETGGWPRVACLPWLRGRPGLDQLPNECPRIAGA